MAADEHLTEKICKVRELFGGRFSDEEICFFLSRCQNDERQTVAFLLDTEPQDLRRILEEEQKSWKTVFSRKILTLRRNGKDILTAAASGTIGTDLHLFSCAGCNIFWWRRVPERKKVSRCDRCRTRYNPVPRNKEWGWAKFECQSCGNVFHGFGQMEVTRSPCYRCQNPVFPSKVMPPSRSNPNERRSRSQHRCDAGDCCAHGYYGGQNQGAQCVKRHWRNVLWPSEPHISSGSTVDTFILQDDLLQTVEEVFTPALPTILE